MDRIKLELLEASYLEHFKFAKDLAFIFPITHPKRKRVEEELNKLQLEINKIKNRIK